jgi:hypothetical protein
MSAFGRLARRVSVARRGFRGVVLEILGGVQRGPTRALASLALFATARGGGRKRRGSTARVKICPRVGHDPAPADHLARLRVVGVVVQRPSRVLRGIGREGPAAVARRSHLSALPRGTPRRAPTAHRESPTFCSTIKARFDFRAGSVTEPYERRPPRLCSANAPEPPNVPVKSPRSAARVAPGPEKGHALCQARPSKAFL